MKFPDRHSLPDIDTYLELTFDQFKLIGRSIAGVETVFSIPQFNVTFDTGRAPHFAYGNDTLALTHWHLDHAGGVAFYLGLRCLNSLSPLNIVMPDKMVPEATTYLEALKHLCSSEIYFNILKAGEGHEIRKGLTLKAVKNFHVVPSTGYALWQRRHKLKAEFVGKSQVEIINAKKAGLAVQDEINEMVFAFSGDSTGDFLKGEATQAKVLVMECSFFSDDGDAQKIKLYGHTHILDWAEHAEKITAETVIMSHTSQRYDKKYIEQQCRKYLPKELTDRLVIFR